MKICGACSQAKPLTAFFARKSSSDGYQFRCKECTNKTARVRRIANLEQARSLHKQRRDSFRAEMQSYKSEQGCYFCEETEPVCLDFHHVDESSKRFNPSNATGRSEFYSEVNKCIVLCSNCHRKLHAGLIKYEIHPG